MHMKKYKIGIDIWAIILFLAIMFPNFVWFAVPAPNDILRQESITPVMDSVASVCQVLSVALLAVVERKDIYKVRISTNLVYAMLSYIVYLIAWLFYYRGITSSLIIVLLCTMPCLALGSYAVDRKNIPAIIPLAVFTVCHLLYGVINFIL